MAIAHTSGLKNAAAFTITGGVSGFGWSYPAQGTTADTFVSWIWDDLYRTSGDTALPYWGGSALTNPIPSNVTIAGLTVRIRKTDGGSAYLAPAGLAITDNVIQLIYNGSFVGDNKSTGAAWPDTISYQTYGSPTDSWNVSGGLTPSIINSAGFGISISGYGKWTGVTALAGGNRIGLPSDDVRAFGEIPVAAIDGIGAGQVAIDVVEITVFYDSPTPLNILPTTVGTAQSSPINHRLLATNRLFATTVGTGQSVARQLLYARKNLFQTSIGTGQSVGNINRLTTRANILQSTLSTTEIVSQSTLKTFANILPVTVGTGQSVSISSLTTRASVFPVTVSTAENITQPKLSALYRILPSTIDTVQSIPITNRLLTFARILPSTIDTTQNISNTSRLTSRLNIYPSTVATGQSVGLQTLLTGFKIYPTTITSVENVAAQKLQSQNAIFPVTVGTGQSVARVTLYAPKSIFPTTITSLETVNTLRLKNRFYDTVDVANTFTYGDTGSFTWDNTWSLYSGGYSLKRTGLTGVKTLAYQMPFDCGDDFYWQSYVKIDVSPGIAGVGFGISSTFASNGYFAVIDARNSSASTSTNSFQIRKVTGGASPVTTVLASYNLANLVQVGQVYRIIVTWSAAGLITAKLYNAYGSTLVSTLTATDTTYTTGYMGITAFSDAFFDHLTNIPAQFTTSDLIASQEVVSSTTAVRAGQTKIYPTTVGTGESVAVQKLSPTWSIYPTTVGTGQSVSNNTRLYNRLNIYPTTITSTQTVSAPAIYKPGSQITQNNSIATTQLITGHLLRAGSVTIQPITVGTGQSIPTTHRLTSALNIFPSTVGTGQSVPTIHKLVARFNINPTTIGTGQSTPTTHLLTTRKNIYPVTVGTGQSVPSTHRLNSTRNIFPVTVGTGESTSNNTRLISRLNILPVTIGTGQSVPSVHRLTVSNVNIYPTTVGTGQSIPTIHRLTSRSEIYPVTVGTGQSVPTTHRLTTRLNIYPVTVGTGQSIPTVHQLINAFGIRPSTIPTVENVPTTHRLVSRAYIYQSTVGQIATGEIITGHKLNPRYNIYPVTVGTGQSVPTTHKLFTIQNILPVTIGTGQSTPSTHRLAPGKVNIYPTTVGTGQSIPTIHRLDSSLRIYPFTVGTGQSIVLTHRLVPGITKIYPIQISTAELLPTNHKLNARYFIYPFTYDDQQPIKGPGTFLKYGQYIYTNNDFDGQDGYSPIKPIAVPPLRLTAIAYINPITLETMDVLPDHNLTYKIDIRPETITSEENISLLHRLSAVAFIRPFTIDSLETISTHRLNAINKIYPYTIDSEERIAWNQVDVKLTPYNGSVGTAIELTKNGNELFTWNDLSYPRVEVIINGNVLGTGYAFNSSLGTLYLSSPITASDTLVVNLYISTTPPSHKLIYHAYIYPFTIQSQGKAGYHKLKYQSFPGTIHSWFEKRQTIESDLNFRSKS